MYVTDTSLATLLRMGLTVQTTHGTMYDRFKVGQILRGAVTAIADDEHVELMLNGHKIVGKTDLNLKAGDALTLKVMESDEGVILQLLAPEISEDEAQNSAQAFLRMVGLPGDKLNTRIVLLLAAQRADVNKKDIESLHDLFTELVGSENDDPENAKLKTLIFLHKHNLPINRQTLALALRYLRQGPDFGGHLGKFTELFNSSGLPDELKMRLKGFTDAGAQSAHHVLDNKELLGLYLERQLACRSYEPGNGTLKSFLLDVLNWLRSPIGSELSNENHVQLQYHASELLHAIEYDQLLNSSARNRDLLWLYVPVLLDGRWQTVQL